MMKRCVCICLLLCLCGCSGTAQMDRVLSLREQALSSGCSFAAEITASYTDKLFVFTLDCTADADGAARFSVRAPESIAGIAGSLSGESGLLTFDDTAVAFPLLADGTLSPIGAPWVLVKALRGGYITSVGAEETGLRVSVDDSYADDALHLDIWLDDTDTPVCADILYGGTKIVSMKLENFTIG